MPVNIGGGEKGPNALASVTVDGDKVAVKYLDGDKADYPITIFKEDAPEGLVTGLYHVNMAADLSKIWNVRPGKQGKYIVKFDGFRKDDNGVPKIFPQETPAGAKWEFPKLIFYADLIIIRGDYRGTIVSMRVPYTFEEYQSTGDAWIKGRGVQTTQNFLESMGVDFLTDTIPMSENVLVWLEKFLHDKNKIAQADINDKGYVDTLSGLSDDLVAVLLNE